MCVSAECAFGELVQCWGILWRPLRKDLSKDGALLSVLCKLHNYCKDTDPKFRDILPSCHCAANYGDNDGFGRSTPHFAYIFPYDEDVAQRMQDEAYQPCGANLQHAWREALAAHCDDGCGGGGHLKRPPHSQRIRTRA